TGKVQPARNRSPGTMTQNLDVIEAASFDPSRKSACKTAKDGGFSVRTVCIGNKLDRHYFFPVFRIFAHVFGRYVQNLCRSFFRQDYDIRFRDEPRCFYSRKSARPTAESGW